MKIVKKIQLKIDIFTAEKNCCILHGRVFVMFVATRLTQLVERPAESSRLQFPGPVFASCNMFYHSLNSAYHSN